MAQKIRPAALLPRHEDRGTDDDSKSQSGAKAGTHKAARTRAGRTSKPTSLTELDFDRATAEATLPRVVIVGRPNVGKSALFNRLVGSDLAIVFDRPGVTRDCLYEPVVWNGRAFLLTDTGGLMADALAALTQDRLADVARVLGAPGLPALVERQAAAAVASASLVVLCVDAVAGLNPAERELADWLRRAHAGVPVVVAANKSERDRWGGGLAAEFWALGLGEPVPVSALSGSGTGDLLDRVVAALPEVEQETWPGAVERKGIDAATNFMRNNGRNGARGDDLAAETSDGVLDGGGTLEETTSIAMDCEATDVLGSSTLAARSVKTAAVLPTLEPADSEPGTTQQEPIAVAIVGRPNVGKSSLLNCIVGTVGPSGRVVEWLVHVGAHL